MNDNNSEALNNLISSIQEKMNNGESNSNNTNSNFDINSLLNTITANNNSNNNNSNNNSNQNNFNIDPNILLKLQKIISAMNSNSPQKDLLLSLKPFLRKTRQDKIGEYLTILNVISAFEALKGKGSD